MLWKQFLQSITMGMLLPGLLFSGADAMLENSPEPQASQQESQTQTWIPVLKKDGRIVAMELEEYVGCVVLGEMPASFDEEALKAQAVAARTYTLRIVAEGDRHNGAICTDYTCCQEYIEPATYLNYRGTQAHMEKVLSAVRQTAGEVLVYDGELICATYFASAGGLTEDAAEVWGNSIPYLKAVSSPESSVYDGEQLSFTKEQLQELLDVELKGSPESWIGTATYTVGGGVDTLRIGDRRYSGVELRSLLGLRSTVFTVTAQQDSIVFETVGYGHRVGMSQYGADAMADSGSSYVQILSHYYSGAVLQAYRND